MELPMSYLSFFLLPIDMGLIMYTLFLFSSSFLHYSFILSSIPFCLDICSVFYLFRICECRLDFFLLIRIFVAGFKCACLHYLAIMYTEMHNFSFEFYSLFEKRKQKNHFGLLIYLRSSGQSVFVDFLLLLVSGIEERERERKCMRTITDNWQQQQMNKTE